MSVAVVELIALELLRRLRLLVNQSTYNTDVSEVIRPVRLDQVTPIDRQIVLTSGASEEVPELSYPGNPPSVAVRQTFNIRCHLLTDEQSIEAIDTTVHTFVADVRKIVTYGDSSWHTFDDNAIDAAWQSIEYIQSDGIDGANVPIAILYRTDENDPYVRRA